ncbi:MAG TPA: hypothetical protein VEC18_09470 [Myxococcota bacterium]|nr:hypothetical protein [Myxococcota bacterium]
MPYLIAAYAIVIGSLAAYALWVRRARSRLRQDRDRDPQRSAQR